MKVSKWKNIYIWIMIAIVFASLMPFSAGVQRKTDEEMALLREHYPVNDKTFESDNIPGWYGDSKGYIFKNFTYVIKGKLGKQIPDRSEALKWYFDVEEVLWTDEYTSDLPEIAGKEIVVGVPYRQTELPDILKKGERYVFAGTYRANSEYFYLRKNSSFYVTDDDYLLSFVSGENANMYTGFRVNYLKTDFQKSYERWKTDLTYREAVKEELYF